MVSMAYFNLRLALVLTKVLAKLDLTHHPSSLCVQDLPSEQKTVTSTESIANEA